MGLSRSRLERAERLVRSRSAGPDPRLARYRADPALLMADAGYAPDPWQRDLLRGDARRVLLLASRQVGKSQTAAFLVLKQALLTPNSTVLIAAPSERQSKEMLAAKVRPALTRLGHPVPVATESALSIRLANGSRVIALPGDEKTVRVYTADLIVLDEAARVLDPLYYAVRPMLATTGGALVCLTSAFAKSGFFHAEWTGSDPTWTRVRVPATACRRISPAFLASEKKALGDRWYAMEYMCEFGDDVAAVFRGEDVRAALDDDVEPLFPVPAAEPDPTPTTTTAPEPGIAVGIAAGAMDDSVEALFG